MPEKMPEKVLPKIVFESLVKHLVRIEEKKEQLLDRYYPDITKEREDFIQLIDNYMQEVENYISSARVVEDESISCPFVIIGSVVELENIDSNEIEKYRIVLPFECEISADMDYASFLSPLGRALLLKGIMDKVQIENPMGQFTYIIRSIDIPKEMYCVTSNDG